KGMHRELSSKSADGWSFNNMFAAPTTFNFTLTRSAPKAAPTALPRSIADALNTSPNVSHVGA
ncbi:MAG TPA: hypothetical protein VGI86_21130, partial [Acidimicrobiia bacterium]